MEIPILVVVFFIIFLYVLILFNSLKRKSLKVRQAESGIEIYLTQRFDLIPNLVECVKAYSNHEKNLFDEISKLRAAYNQNKNLKTGEELNKKYYNLISVAENYPDLKASEQFLNLQKNLSKIESQIQAARRIYNSEATKFNIAIGIFPNNIVAHIFRFKKANLFEAEPDANNSINVNLDK